MQARSQFAQLCSEVSMVTCLLKEMCFRFRRAKVLKRTGGLQNNLGGTQMVGIKGSSQSSSLAFLIMKSHNLKSAFFLSMEYSPKGRHISIL